jgi:sulfoxide reductase heme-binding subunit YedZ
MWRRAYNHHLPLCLLTLASIAMLYVTRPYRDVITKVSFATAYPALVLLITTLLIGPWNMLRGRRTPVSMDLRRDIGIWAGIIGLVHAVVGQCVHLRGRPWLYYIYEHRKNGPTGLRHDLFGFNNFTGLGATVILIALFATSNDWFLRRLGTRQWKQMQRWNYACFALTSAHAIGYQTMEHQAAPFVATALVCISLTVILQVTGFAMSRSKYRIGF